jgi:hypothetical protein
VGCWWQSACVSRPPGLAAAEQDSASNADEAMRDVPDTEVAAEAPARDLEVSQADPDDSVAPMEHKAAAGLPAAARDALPSEADALLELLRTCPLSRLDGVTMAGNERLISRAALQQAVPQEERVLWLGALLQQ